MPNKTIMLLKLRLAKAIADKIKYTDLTQKELAAKLNVAQSSISRLKNMELTSSIETMLEIIDALEIDLMIDVNVK